MDDRKNLLPVFLFPFQLEVVRFRSLVLRIACRMDFEQVERFDELKEFFVAEDADIEVRELADDKAAPC